jgi:hypothetical protein
MRMAPLRRAQLSRFLRLLTLGMLVFGLLVKPVLAATCELEDLQWAVGQVELVDAGDADAGDECCPGQACGECCTAGTAVPPLRAIVGAIAVVTIHAHAGAVEFEPAPYPVSIRPPIAG